MFQTHQMSLSAVPFNKITLGTKVIESRLFDAKRQQIVVGDQIIFKKSEDTSERVVTKVTAIYKHPTFKDLFEKHPPELFGGTNKADLLEKIRTYYSIDQEKKCGVVGISIKKKRN